MAQKSFQSLPKHRLKLALLSLMCFQLACKPASESGTLSEAVDNSKLPMHQIPLKNFGYELPDAFLKALAERMDCASLKQIVAFPKQGLKNGVIALTKSQYVYRDLEANFYDAKFIEKYCQTSKVRQNQNSGAIALAAAGKKKNYKVRLVITSGYRLQLTSKLLGDSLEAWDKSSPGFAVSRVNCSNPFTTTALCAKDYLEQINKLPEDEQLLFWTHGKGGNVVLEALAADRSLRDRTLGVITVSSPLGGSAALTVARKLFTATGKLLTKFNIGIDPAEFERDPFQFLMTPIEQKTSIVQKINNAGANLTEASLELHPAERYKSLQQFASKDFSSSKGNIPVFHVASLLDIATLKPIPPITYSSEGLVASSSAKTWGHFLQVLAIPSFYDFPLSDGAVALQHAVLPREFTPKGLNPQMLALFRLDHTSLAFVNDYQAIENIPNVAIVDALLAAVAEKL